MDPPKEKHELTPEERVEEGKKCKEAGNAGILYFYYLNAAKSESDQILNKFHSVKNNKYEIAGCSMY